MIGKYLCLCAIFINTTGSHGIFQTNQNVKLMHDYIKQLEKAIHNLDSDVTRFGPSYYLNNNTTVNVERRAQFLNDLVIPGRSGSYATSNSFYMYGKLISTSMSVAFVPIVQNIPGIVPAVAPYPNLPSRPSQPPPALAVESPDDDYPQETTTTTEAPLPPERKKINPHLFYNPYFPQYFPYYVPAYNLYPIRNLGDPKGVPNDRFGPQSRFG